jgi:hypothetical protein
VQELSRLDRHAVKAGEQYETDEAGVDGSRLWGGRQVHPETACVAEATDSLAKYRDAFRFTRIRYRSLLFGRAEDSSMVQSDHAVLRTTRSSRRQTGPIGSGAWQAGPPVDACHQEKAG